MFAKRFDVDGRCASCYRSSHFGVSLLLLDSSELQCNTLRNARGAFCGKWLTAIYFESICSMPPNLPSARVLISFSVGLLAQVFFSRTCNKQTSTTNDPFALTVFDREDPRKGTGCVVFYCARMLPLSAPPPFLFRPRDAFALCAFVGPCVVVPSSTRHGKRELHQNLSCRPDHAKNNDVMAGWVCAGEWMRIVGRPKPGLTVGGELRTQLERDFSEIALS